jgi:pimeloyl-ACP methyl ester carboxylesterase
MSEQASTTDSSAPAEQPANPELFNRRRERLDHTWHDGFPGREEVAVIGHGVTGNKDREWAVTLARVLAEAGLPTLRLSFSGNGESEGRFEDSCPTKEAEDLLDVLDALDGRRVVYLGHSMGAAVGVLAASRGARISWLVSLAGMVHTAEFARRKFGEQVPGEDCMWEKPECPLSQAFLDDMERVGSVVDLVPLVRVPWLLVHGTADEVVPLQDSHDAVARARGNAELVTLEGADHVFTGTQADAMSRVVLEWLSPKIAPAES